MARSAGRILAGSLGAGALVICAPERGAVSPNFPHLLSPDQQGDSSCPTDRAAVCDRPDEQLTAFVELESATQRRGELA